MATSHTILIVDDNKSILTSLQFLLGDVFAHVLSLSSPQGLYTLLQRERVDVVLLDMNFSAGVNNGNEGLFWLQEIRKVCPELPVVLFTAYADVALAVEGLKRGAVDFVVKPWDNAKLVQTLLSACNSREKIKKKPERSHLQDMYWGDSEAMKQLRILVERCSDTDANILITGENGTGKEMLAQEIHRLSARNREPLVTVDMGAVTDSLFESELFGHVKGSFTDARQDREGRFQAADRGTLFLDEIGNLPLHSQAKLLTVLQRRQVVKVGSNVPESVDIRLICATNRNLQEMVLREEFREDLLYRINTIHLHLPALRERKEDIIPLAECFMQRYARKYGRTLKELSPDVKRMLEIHPWYGNIRELLHTLERAVIMSEGEVLCPEQVNLSVSSLVTGEHVDKMRTLEEVEYEAVKQAVRLCKGNFSLAASRLGISRQTLYNKMKRYGL